MTFVLTLSGIIFILILILVAIQCIITKQKSEIEKETPDSPSIIHTSGIYSIVRKSPRDQISRHKPSEKEILQYLNQQNVLTKSDGGVKPNKTELVMMWKTSLEHSLKAVEDGDKKGLEFYYYDFQGSDPVCRNYIEKGNFITREDIYRFPQLLPPFHLGCKCILKCHHGLEDLRETTEMGMRPFFTNNSLPAIPDWKKIVNI